ncbi:GmrSD restriction endonuclease domain-containing protein [Clostridium isatidis]|uniref:GmrSD restriction endonuclease domain-containing protein n=1 Tax=Clostridium isatidis TaxID=182773 RepID=UPI003AABACEC
MAFQTPLTINEVITNIHSKKYLLPSIQREFVWSTEQITKLFDSLMRDYPINAFLFWKVSKENLNEFRFYEFLRDYHQRKKRHNEKADLSGSEDVIAVLDGQQRLTSLYIGLKGSYAYKLSYKRWDNEQAYPARKLYLNLLSSSEDPEYEYEFEFLTDSEVRNDEDHFWFKVGDMLDMKSLSDVMKFWSKNIVFSTTSSEKADFANDTLSKLYAMIHVNPIISYYLEQSKELDKVLNIFIRVNSGGTTLSYSDLLLSFATAQWDKKDAREEINNFVDEINEIGRGFNVNKDFVLKACLVLSDFSDISFKVDNFNKSNMLKIQDKWDDITKAIRDAVRLISSFGFSRENITSNNLIIPIAYYLKHIGLPDNFEVSSSRISDRAKIKKWFTLSLLKRVFSFMPDGVLKPVRDIINKNTTGEFPLDEIINHFKGTNRTLVFTNEDISNLLYAKYGQGDTLVILSILYPWADLRNNFHIDHIFPKSGFTKKKLEKRGIPADRIEYYLENYNYIGNLQLLESIPNIEKNNMDFDKWISETIPAETLDDYKTKHYIPKNIDLSISNFEQFLEEREKMIIQKLESELL